MIAEANLAGVAVVIPCYRSAGSIEGVVRRIPRSIPLVVCVDDASDDDLSGVLVRLAKSDPRVRVVTHEVNGGVGAATISGFDLALAEGARVIVKIDSDGQMNPVFIPRLVEPILAGEADYVKGNRFFDIGQVRRMPAVRLIGNAGLSFLTKLSTGYWQTFDPTNGFFAIHAEIAAMLPLEKLHRRYFFESDMLFRLSVLGARVVELPMETRYGGEKSHLSEVHALMTFPGLHARNLLKRIFYNYFLRGFSVASLSLVTGFALVAFGLAFGITEWIQSAQTGVPATTGTVMLSATPLLVGLQLLLNFLQHDISMEPDRPIHPYVGRYKTLETPARIEPLMVVAE